MIGKINNLPELSKGWVWTRLENCVDILDSRRVPVNADEREKRTGNVPYYGATGQVGWIDDYLFDEELVLLGEDGAPFLEPLKNKAYIIIGKSWVNNHAHVLRAIASLTSNSFICHYLNVFDYTGFVSGTTRFKLNQSPMWTIPFPLPPLPEQHRIVAKIEELFTRLDAGVEALNKIKAHVKRYRQAVLKHAFEGKLTAEWRQAHKHEFEPASALLECIRQERQKTAKGKYKELHQLDTSALPELPEGWVWTRIAGISTLINGRAFKPSEWSMRGLPIIRIQNLNDPDADFNYCNFEVDDRFVVENGQLLFAWSGTPGTSFGAHIWNRGKAVLNQHIFKIVIGENNINKRFLMHVLNHNVAEFIAKAHGTAGLAHITKGKFEESVIALPSLPE